MKMMYSILEKIEINELQKIKERAQYIIEHQDEFQKRTN